jgi:hypothetical protein
MTGGFPSISRLAFARTLAFPSPARRGRVPRQGRERASFLAAKPQTFTSDLIHAPSTLPLSPPAPPASAPDHHDSENAEPHPPRFQRAGARRVASHGVRARRWRLCLAASPRGIGPLSRPCRGTLSRQAGEGKADGGAKGSRSSEEKAANRWSGKKTSPSRSLRFLANQVYFCSAYLSINEHSQIFHLKRIFRLDSRTCY